MLCPQCNKSECWDNTVANDERALNGEKLRPDYSCKDKECGWVMWRPKDGKKQILKETSKPTPPVEHKSGKDEYIDGKKENNRLICRNNLMIEIIDSYNGITDNKGMVELFNFFWEIIEK